MQLAKLLKLLTVMAVLAFVISASAQQIRFEDFSSTQGLTLNGPQTSTWNNLPVLRFTQGPGNRGSQGNGGSTIWFGVPQPTTGGFTSYFKFIFHNPLQCCAPGDGLAFVIQNSFLTDSTYGATGGGKTAVGVGNGGVGYAGIPNSVAIEFDTTKDAWDPTANHVAVQTCGVKTNGPVHLSGTYTIGNNHNVTSCLYTFNGQNAISSVIPPLGVACGDGGCVDGVPTTVVVEYTPPKDNNSEGRLQVYVDPLLIPSTHTPVANATAQIDIPFTLQKQLTYNTAGGLSLVGITSGYNTNSQTTDLIAWEYTPHVPTQITQQIQNGGTETQFDYGDHVYGVTYPPGFVNTGGILMTVNAIPIDQTVFFNTRLKNNTIFNNEQCLRYFSTGNNNCIVYQVTCQDPVTQQNVPCPNPDENQLIDTRTSYSTPDPVNADNADYIKTPIGTNNWCSIFTGFMENEFDPTTTGKGNNFSDFVATFKVTPGVDSMCQTSGNARLKKLPASGTSLTDPISGGGNR